MLYHLHSRQNVSKQYQFASVWLWEKYKEKIYCGILWPRERVLLFLQHQSILCVKVCIFFAVCIQHVWLYHREKNNKIACHSKKFKIYVAILLLGFHIKFFRTARLLPKMAKVAHTSSFIGNACLSLTYIFKYLETSKYHQKK